MNQAASITRRLRNYAATTKQDFNAVLTRYGAERLLFRLSQSKHANSFILKGALLFLFWNDLPDRPTRDIDLLGFGAEDVSSIEAIFRDICAVESADAVNFLPEKVRVQTIRKQAGYGGVRVTLVGKIGNIQLPVQIDVGFGDAVTPDAMQESFPVILDDLPAPVLRVYPKYTVCAEKLEAISSLGMVNTRLKDFYDLWLLLTSGDLVDDLLVVAIAATFERRKAGLGETWPTGLTDTFSEDPFKQRQWEAFVGKNGLAAPGLKEVVTTIREHLEGPMDGVRARKKRTL